MQFQPSEDKYLRPPPKRVPAFLWHYIDWECGPWLLLNFIANSVTAFLLVSFSWVIGEFTDIAVNKGAAVTWQDLETPLYIMIAMLVALFFMAQLRINSWRLGRVPFEMNMKERLFRFTQQHSHKYFSDFPSGNVAHKITEIPWNSSLVIDMTFYGIIPTIMIMLYAIIYFFIQSWILGAVTLIWAVIFLISVALMAYKCGELARMRSFEKGHVAGAVVDSITNNVAVRTFAGQRYEAGYVGGQIYREKFRNYNFFKGVRNMMLVRDALVTVYFIGIVLLAIYLQQSGIFSVGLITMTVTIALIILQKAIEVTNAIIGVSESSGIISEGIDLLNRPLTVQDKGEAHKLIPGEGDIRFDNVHFSFNGQDRVFEQLNLHIPPRQKIGLIGHSGAGKSTLVSLLLRFHDIDIGEIRIDNQNIADVTQSSLREHIAFIPQDTSLFHRSLMDNIRYGRLDASDEEVIEAAKKAHAHDFIKDLPEGYETLVGERGVKLSGGQRQRIAIARAIVKDAPILVLDEATSALDSESEKWIQESLKELMEGKTVIAIAHRLSTISHLDRLIVMHEGAIIEDGSHTELLKKGGQYSRLWAMQSGGFLNG